MKLFRKKETKKTCCSDKIYTAENMQKAEKAKNEKGIQILGSGCAKCTALENAVRLAITELGLNLEISHVTDFAQIASYGVMTTPALVFNNKVISYGKVLDPEEVKTLLNENMPDRI